MNGIKHGFGVLVYPNSDEFEGGFIKDKKVGFGKFTQFDTGIVFEGPFENDVLSGFGTIHYPNDDKYEGEVNGFKRENYGTMHFKNGNTFEGSFKADCIDGYGAYTYIEAPPVHCPGEVYLSYQGEFSAD